MIQRFAEWLWRFGPLCFAVTTGLLCIGADAFMSSNSARITVFLAIPLALSVFFLFLLSVLISIAKLVRDLKRSAWRACMPLFVNAGVVGIILSVPYHTIWFFYLLGERESVVEAVHEGTLQPNVEHNRSLIRLPDTYRNLSDGGNEIVVQRAGDGFFVFFFTSRGILENYSGYLYVPEGARPEDCYMASGSSFMDVDRVAPHWYSVLSG